MRTSKNDGIFIPFPYIFDKRNCIFNQVDRFLLTLKCIGLGSINLTIFVFVFICASGFIWKSATKLCRFFNSSEFRSCISHLVLNFFGFLFLLGSFSILTFYRDSLCSFFLLSLFLFSGVEITHLITE